MKIRLSGGSGPDTIIDSDAVNGYEAVASTERKIDKIPSDQASKKSHSERQGTETREELSRKFLLTLDEAARYTGIGVNKLRDLSNDESCDFVLWNGSRRLLKRTKLEAYLDKAYSI